MIQIALDQILYEPGGPGYNYAAVDWQKNIVEMDKMQD
jgi:hypothetical protein